MDRKRLYCLLGAEKFQKIVFCIEKEKYKILEKFFPNIREWYEKQSDRLFKKKIKKEDAENRLALLNEYQNQKLAFRKELVYKKNRNYHYNVNYPTKFIKYLEWNKKVHMRGIKKDSIVLFGIGAISLMLDNPMPTVSTMLALSHLLSLAINFECVNLQNYNLYRFKNEKIYSSLEKLEEKKKTRNLEKLGESIVPVSKAITNQIELPTIDQVVEQITTIEQAQKLKEYVKEQYLCFEKESIREYKKEKRKI